MTFRHLIGLGAFAVFVIAGCSQPAPETEPQARQTPIEHQEMASLVPVSTMAPVGEPTDGGTDDESDQDGFVPPFPKKMDFFSPPKVPVVVQETSELDDSDDLSEAGPVLDIEGAARKFALRGFVNVDGVKAIVLWDLEPLVVQEGEKVGPWEVTRIEPPNITLQLGEYERTWDLYARSGEQSPARSASRAPAQPTTETAPPPRRPMTREPTEPGGPSVPALPPLPALPQPPVPVTMPVPPT